MVLKESGLDYFSLSAVKAVIEAGLDLFFVTINARKGGRKNTPFGLVE